MLVRVAIDLVRRIAGAPRRQPLHRYHSIARVRYALGERAPRFVRTISALMKQVLRFGDDALQFVDDSFGMGLLGISPFRLGSRRFACLDWRRSGPPPEARPHPQQSASKMPLRGRGLVIAPLAFLQDAENVQPDDDDDRHAQQPKTDTFHLSSPEV